MESMIQLTTVARAHAEQNGLLGRLQETKLGYWVVAGDVIAFGDQRFMVRERRIEVAENGELTRLVFVLDYPARIGG